MKKLIYASKYDYIDEFLEELAYETCDLNEEFSENEWKEFKEACKDNGYPRVTKRDFATYLDKVSEIRRYEEED